MTLFYNVCLIWVPLFLRQLLLWFLHLFLSQRNHLTVLLLKYIRGMIKKFRFLSPASSLLPCTHSNKHFNHQIIVWLTDVDCWYKSCHWPLLLSAICMYCFQKSPLLHKTTTTASEPSSPHDETDWSYSNSILVANSTNVNKCKPHFL